MIFMFLYQTCRTSLESYIKIFLYETCRTSMESYIKVLFYMTPVVHRWNLI